MEPSTKKKKNPFRLFGERKRANNIFTTNHPEVKYKQQEITCYMTKNESKNVIESESYPWSVFSNYLINQPYFESNKDRTNYSQQFDDKINQKKEDRNIQTNVKRNPFKCKEDADSISIPSVSLYGSNEDSDYYSVEEQNKTPHTKIEARVSSPCMYLLLKVYSSLKKSIQVNEVDDAFN